MTITAFHAAYDAAARQAGRTQLISLCDVRRQLSQLSRDQFDALLHGLRLAGTYSLDSAQCKITDEQRAGAIVEGTSRLVYISRV